MLFAVVVWIVGALMLAGTPTAIRYYATLFRAKDAEFRRAGLEAAVLRERADLARRRANNYLYGVLLVLVLGAVVGVLSAAG